MIYCKSKSCNNVIIKFSVTFLIAVTLTACGDWGIDYLPPEELHPSTGAEAAPMTPVTMAPPQATPTPRATAPTPTPAQARPPAAPQAAATAAAPTAPVRPHLAVAGTCDRCHPLSTLAESETRGDAWSGLVSGHASTGKVTLTAEEKSALVSQLRRTYP